MQHNLHSTFKKQHMDKSTFFISKILHNFRYNMMKITALFVLLFIAVSRVTCTTKNKIDSMLGFYVTDKDTKQPYASTYKKSARSWRKRANADVQHHDVSQKRRGFQNLSTL